MCEACRIIKEKKARIVYEDERTLVFMPEKPLVEGHVTLLSKEHYSSIEDVPKEMIDHFFYVASFAATTLFEGLGAEGTNIIMNDGAVSKYNHFAIDVIPRKQNDGIDFKWEAKKFSEVEMNEAKEKISWELAPSEEQALAPAENKRHVTTVSQKELDKNEKDSEKKKMDFLVESYRKIP